MMLSIFRGESHGSRYLMAACPPRVCPSVRKPIERSASQSSTKTLSIEVGVQDVSVKDVGSLYGRSKTDLSRNHEFGIQHGPCLLCCPSSATTASTRPAPRSTLPVFFLRRLRGQATRSQTCFHWNMVTISTVSDIRIMILYMGVEQERDGNCVRAAWWFGT